MSKILQPHIRLMGYSRPEGAMKTQNVVPIGAPECAEVQLVSCDERGYTKWRVDVTTLANADLAAVQRLVDVLDRRVAEERATVSPVSWVWT